MIEIADGLRRFLEESGRAYELIPHHTDHTAGQTAWDTHTPAHAFAKTVFIKVDGALAMAVVPADDQVSLRKLELALDAGSVELADEAEMADACPDCEIGAAPPFGALYDLPVYVSLSLGESESITFNGGTHRTAVRMAYQDFLRLSEAQVLPLARHD